MTCFVVRTFMWCCDRCNNTATTHGETPVAPDGWARRVSAWLHEIDLCPDCAKTFDEENPP